MTDRSLAGISVVVTRAAEQNSDFINKLQALGADVVVFPVIEIVDPLIDTLSDRVANIDAYEWVVLTSANAVERIGTSLLRAKAVAVIGSATAEAVASYGIAASFVPSSFVAESFLAEFPNGTGTILLPQGDRARSTLKQGLQEKGWTVDAVEAYRTIPTNPSESVLAQAQSADVIAFTSPSTVANYVAIANQTPQIVACIGPITATTARENGLDPVTAHTHTIDGLVDVIVTAVRK